MGRTRHWVIIIIGVTASAITGAGGAALGLGPVLIALSSVVLGIGGALLAKWAFGDIPMITRGSQTAAPAAEAIETGVGRELLGDIPLALVLLDRYGRARLQNQAASELFGPMVAGQPLSSISRAPPLADAVSRVAAGGAPATVEFTHLRAREERVLLAHVRALDASLSDRGSGIMILIEDHTRSARIEQMRRDFVANVSHELRTPLASIAGFIETLQGPAAGDPAASARFLPIMAREAERMKRLVTDLMSLNRIEMDEHVRPSTTVDVGAIIREAAAALSPQAESAGVGIEIDLPDAGAQVTGDRDELNQLFINVLDNAIKYGGAGGAVRIHAAPDEPGRTGMVGISVTDRGPGIPRQHIPRLTERFYRVSDSRSREMGGTGLGLSIVKHILNRHRGDLTIRSAPGEGASFTAWLPRAKESATREKA